MNEERKRGPHASERNARDDTVGAKAEARLSERLGVEGGQSKCSRADLERHLYELQVREIELELRNAELKEARDEATAALRKFTDLYNSAPIGYFTLDKTGGILDANAAGEELLGMSGSSLAGRTFFEFVLAAERQAFDRFLKKVFQSRTRNAFETKLVRIGGKVFEADLEAVVSVSGDACRLAVVDITERKRAEKDSLVLSKLESTGILAGGIAHDFNNLLTVILLNLNMARAIAPQRKKLLAHLEQAEETALMARNLTQQLLTFAEGGTPLRRPAALTEVISEGVRGALSGSRIECEFSLPDDLWAIEIDKAQIGQVVRNLVLNAREAMPVGGLLTVQAENVVLDMNERVSLPPGEYVRVSISDSGGGIPGELIPKIFDPYFSTKKRGEQKGMGLGLTICHSIIQKHGGTITVDSMEGVGTAFNIYLPASPSERRIAKVISPAVSRNVRRVLVMDDEEWVREVLGVTIRELGHDVELAKDGRETETVFCDAREAGTPFDVVILDLTVRNGSGGRETIKSLLSVEPRLNAIIMSGYGNDPVIMDYKRYGFKGALIKPFSIEELSEVLSSVLSA